MSIFNWIAKHKQKEYTLSIEKQLLLANVRIVSLQERLAHYMAKAANQEEVIKALINHGLNDSKDKNSNVIFLKPKRKPKK